MARFKIISKDGGTIRYEGKPKYVGTYLRPSYLEFSEIASSVPIAWEVGDYVEYSRTGMTYRLYSIPQATKNARKGSHGRAFTYSGVQLFAATKELEIALFRDLVSNDNNIHFSTSPDVVTFEDVYGIARRIQECMDDFYPGRWEIRVADFDESEDAEIISKISEAKDFALSGGTCLDALSRIYELWQDIGWIHTHEDGKEIIIIGHANKRIDANTTYPFLYGKGNGLTAIKKNQTNKDEFATRLYVYGSERNLPSRYYNTKAILNAESVDIRNLMIPLDLWGKTDGLPDARKAYLENADAVAKYGVIPKVHYFDSEDAGADIHPSIKGMTIGNLRKELDAIGQTNYYPAYDIYPDDDERVDEILYADNPQDDGLIYKNGKKYLSTYDNPTSEQSGKTNTDVLVSSCVFELSEEAGPCELSIISDHSITLQDKDYSRVTVTVIVETAPVVTRMPLAEKTVEGTLEDGLWQINLPDFKVKGEDIKSDRYSFYVFLFVDAGNGEDPYTISSGTFSYKLSEIKASEFTIHLKQIGFDISHQASIGNGCKVAINTGACAGRSFVVSKCQSTTNGWLLTAKRQQDDSVGSLFPNQDYQIVSGDRFVLIDIAMPDIYITTAQDRLLNEGNKLLERASKIQNHYEPSIDAKVMMESGRTLREGMFMEITDEDVVDNTTDYILIDSLSIIEDESSIPTYKVTLKERRKVTYKGTPSATSTTDTETSVGGSENEEGFATETFVTEQINILKGLWHIDESTGYLVTDHQVHIKKSLLIDGDVASGGEGEDTPAEGTVTRIDVDGIPYNPDSLGVIDLSEAFKNVTVDLSDYYTKYEVNELIDEIKAGDIDLANYYTKEEIDGKGFLTSASLVGYATTGYVSEAISDLNIGQFATKTALAATVEALSTEIGKKANADDVADTYATKTALSTLQSSHDTLRAEFDALDDALNDDVSGKINTWNEIVDFLDEYSGSEDLATIISKINTDIAKRALQSDLTDLATRVGTAEGNITSLTNGKADKATTLAGYGITDAYTKGETDSLLGKYVLLEKASQTIKGDITIEGNLVITGDVASGGEGGNTPAEGTVTGVTVSGVDYTSVEAGLLDLTDLMANYALKSDSTKVSVSPSLSSGKSIGVISVDGVGTTLYAPATYAWSEISDRPTKLSQFTDDVVSGNYLPLSGGNLTGVLTINTYIDRSLVLDDSTGEQHHVISFAAGGKEYSHIAASNLTGDNVLTFNGNTLIHSGNIGDYAFISRGSILSNVDADTLVTNGVYLNQTGNGSGNSNFPNAYSSFITFAYSDRYASQLSIGYNSFHFRRKIDSWDEWREVIHSGNIGSYAFLKTATKLTSSDTLDADLIGLYSYQDGNNPTNSFGNNAALLSFKGTKANPTYQLAFAGNEGTIGYKVKTTSGTWQPWKTIAFTDSNVASATKLATPRTIWGQSFDGTGDIKYNQIPSFQYAYFVGTDGSTNAGYIGRGANSNNNLYLSTYLSDNNINLVTNGGSLLLNSSGNVTIGEIDLAGTSWKMYVDGNVYHNGVIATNNPIRLYGKTNVSSDVYLDNITYAGLNIRTSSSSYMLIGSNVGIGTTDPQYKLDVNGKIRFEARTIWGQSFDGTQNVEGDLSIKWSKIYWNMDVNNYYIGYNSSEYAFDFVNYYGHRFHSKGSERMRITADGNVGIGKIPDYTLDVAGTGRFTDSLLVSGLLTANSGATITGDVTINGNLIVSGDVASGGQGQDTPSGGNTSTSTSGVLTLTGEIPEGSNIPQSSLDAIGLTDQVIADLLIGKYHHVMYTSGVTTYCFVVSGQYNSDYKAFTLHWGDDYMDEFMGYVFALGSSGGWNITIYEI